MQGVCLCPSESEADLWNVGLNGGPERLLALARLRPPGSDASSAWQTPGGEEGGGEERGFYQGNITHSLQPLKPTEKSRQFIIMILLGI